MSYLGLGLLISKVTELSTQGHFRGSSAGRACLALLQQLAGLRGRGRKGLLSILIPGVAESRTVQYRRIILTDHLYSASQDGIPSRYSTV